MRRWFFWSNFSQNSVGFFYHDRSDFDLCFFRPEYLWWMWTSHCEALWRSNL